MARIIEIIKGHAAPWLVGLLRGVVIAALLGAVGAVIAFLGSPDVPEALLPWAPAIILALRAIEGWLDGRKGSTDGTSTDPFDH